MLLLAADGDADDDGGGDGGGVGRIYEQFIVFIA